MTYTCNDYRQEMRLAGLRMRLNHSELTEAEKEEILEEIQILESDMNLD
ncbi:MAG: hypothetical protein JRH15_05155 [Deltaproteobacteria bacterium]|nr:hypothetical protein [Deltaproteobacteria bacterium]